jgi:hypothetical protein
MSVHDDPFPIASDKNTSHNARRHSKRPGVQRYPAVNEEDSESEPRGTRAPHNSHALSLAPADPGLECAAPTRISWCPRSLRTCRTGPSRAVWAFNVPRRLATVDLLRLSAISSPSPQDTRTSAGRASFPPPCGLVGRPYQCAPADSCGGSVFLSEENERLFSPIISPPSSMSSLHVKGREPAVHHDRAASCLQG